jgi:hypothetical protein
LVVDIAQPEEFAFQLMLGNCFHLGSSLVRKRCVGEINGFDENLSLCEDWDFCFRLAEKFRFAYLEGIVLKHRVTPGSLSTDRTSHYIASEKFMQKVSKTNSFNTAPARNQVEYYYKRGVNALALKRTSDAKTFFGKARELQPDHKLASIALTLTQFFGENAYKFYQLKRLLFGLRGFKRF